MSGDLVATAASKNRRERRNRQIERLRAQVKILTDGMGLIETMTSEHHVKIAEVTCKNVHHIAKSAKAASTEVELAV